MRVVFITHYAALMGANRSLLHLVKGLQKWHGVVPLVLCPKEGPLTQALEDSKIPYAVLPYANWAYTIRSRSLYAFPWLWKTSNDLVFPVVLEQVERFRPDLIHSNSQAVSLGWQLSEALGLPHIWHIREYGWKDYQLVFPLGNAFKLEKLNKANHLICISETIKSHMNGVTAPKTVVFNGIGTRAQLEKRYEKTVDLKGRPFSFLIIGLLQPGKGQHEALQAFAQVYRAHPHCRLVIAGTGQRLYTLRLKMMAWLLGVSKAVEFTGYVPDP
ncbi:MAG: glycosyltransferase, partial [Saprospiraceae bacterium]|nr:glycosyltransferase [Saprospiraceae bacterium]